MRKYLRLYFEVIQEIDNLSFVHCVHWSAMLRDWLRPYIALPLAELGIYPIPVHNGFTEFHVGEIIALDLSFPILHTTHVISMLKDSIAGDIKASFPESHTHFVPGRTLKILSFEQLAVDGDVLDIGRYQREAEELSKQPCLSIIFYTPLRLKANRQRDDYVFFDPLSFAIDAFCEAIAKGNSRIEDVGELLAKGLLWVDVPYEKTLGGLMGGIRISTPKDMSLLTTLVTAQYEGLGKNRSLGFGFIKILESTMCRDFASSAQCISLLKRAASLKVLSHSLEEMKSGSPGPDNLAKEDLLDSGKTYLLSAQKMLLQNRFVAGESLQFRKKTHNGNFRIIKINNIHERHLLNALLRQIESPLDKLLSPSCYSYRSGRDYHQAANKVFQQFRNGFAKALKADIKAFFDSIPRQNLALMIRGLFAEDQIAETMISYLLSDGIGIPQGNPLSPLLSNLYLIPFDAQMRKNGWFMVRYADDFCVFQRHNSDPEIAIEKLSEILSTLALALEPEKCQIFAAADEIHYCGYAISLQKFEKLKQQTPNVMESYGIPAFQSDFVKGKPLYLCFKDSYVTVENGAVIIRKDGENKSLSFKEISRIVIIGKPRVSAGLIQNALLTQKPVVFMTIMGRILGAFAHNRKLFSPSIIYNPMHDEYAAFSLRFIRNLVAAKIHNQRMLLKQNKITEDQLKNLELSLPGCTEADSLRGKEGAASALYWQHFRNLVKPLDFPRRAYHPPEGPVNSLLSIGYTMLYFRMAEALQAAQLNPYEGIFHVPRGLHYALASDLIEQFRFLVDRIVLAMIHNKQITSEDFVPSFGNYSYHLSSEAMKKYIHRFEFVMRSEIKIGDDILNWALVIDKAASQLMRCLRLGLDYRSHRLA